MQTNVKIAGTSFHPLPAEETVCVETTGVQAGVPWAKLSAILMPEPENPHDPDAVKVLIPLSSGKVFHIGYLPRTSELKYRIKTMRPAKVLCEDYTCGNPNLSPSWKVVEVQGLE